MESCEGLLGNKHKNSHQNRLSQFAFPFDFSGGGSSALPKTAASGSMSRSFPPAGCRSPSLRVFLFLFLDFASPRWGGGSASPPPSTGSTVTPTASSFFRIPAVISSPASFFDLPLPLEGGEGGRDLRKGTCQACVGTVTRPQYRRRRTWRGRGPSATAAAAAPASLPSPTHEGTSCTRFSPPPVCLPAHAQTHSRTHICTNAHKYTHSCRNSCATRHPHTYTHAHTHTHT